MGCDGHFQKVPQGTKDAFESQAACRALVPHDVSFNYVFRPWRDSGVSRYRFPNVETLGYFRSSLQDLNSGIRHELRELEKRMRIE